MKRPKQKGEESTKYSMISTYIYYKMLKHSRLKPFRYNIYSEQASIQGFLEVNHNQK